MQWFTSDMISELMSLTPLHITDPLKGMEKQKLTT